MCADLPEERTTLSRRKFFAGGIKAIAGLFALVLGVPLAGFFVSPALKKDEHDWVEISDTPRLKDGEPARITYHYARKDGWKIAEASKTAFVVRQAGGKLEAFSNRCTHLGCGVNWDAASRRFKCPCHGGAFDLSGKVLEGPPPEPLTRLLVKVEADRIFINEA
jgi:menaquinol-cytochrome c reductase iron-sulfur subunit